MNAQAYPPHIRPRSITLQQWALSNVILSTGFEDVQEILETGGKNMGKINGIFRKNKILLDNIGHVASKLVSG